MSMDIRPVGASRRLQGRALSLGCVSYPGGKADEAIRARTDRISAGPRMTEHQISSGSAAGLLRPEKLFQPGIRQKGKIHQIDSLGVGRLVVVHVGRRCQSIVVPLQITGVHDRNDFFGAQGAVIHPDVVYGAFPVPPRLGLAWGTYRW